MAGALGASAIPFTHPGRLLDRGYRALVAPADAPRQPRFHSRPDLKIPTLTVTTQSAAVGAGLLLLAPYNAPLPAQAGAVIVDDTGEPVWEQPLAGLVTADFRVQTYHGKPALTWWQGLIEYGHGVGEYVIADSSYAPLARVNAGNGLHGDLHEFLLTDRGTALLTSYNMLRHDLRAAGGSPHGSIQDAIFQEIDVATGKVLLEWHSLDHIPLTESFYPVSTWWDYVHLNSIAIDSDENLLVSSRNTHTIYKVNRSTGAIMWRLGGKHSDFEIDANALFAWQHDARRHPDGSITLFDNGDSESRALVLAVDEPRRSVKLVREYAHPTRIYANSQGNMQILPNGNVLVGWGAQPYVSEFSATGQLLFDAKLGANYMSYRAYRMPWSGIGAGPPTVVATRTGDSVTAYVSWNGDTRAAQWTVFAGTSRDRLAAIGTVVRTGFETGIEIPKSFTMLRVTGGDLKGQPLATSALVLV